MTVLTTDNRRAYTGDGSTSVYPFPVRFLTDTDVKVAQRVNDEEVLLTIGTDYSVSGAGEAAGGSVTFVSAPAAGVPIVIYNDPPMTQDVDYQEDDEFPANTHERALDKLTILVQRLAGRISRALLYDETADSVLTASQVLGRVGDAETARDQAQSAQVASESAKTDAEAARDAAQATAASVDGPTLQAGIDANASAIAGKADQAAVDAVNTEMDAVLPDGATGTFTRPRMTTTARDALDMAGKAAGYEIYNTTTNQVEEWDGVSAWSPASSGGFTDLTETLLLDRISVIGAPTYTITGIPEDAVFVDVYFYYFSTSANGNLTFYSRLGDASGIEATSYLNIDGYNHNSGDFTSQTPSENGSSYIPIYRTTSSADQFRAKLQLRKIGTNAWGFSYGAQTGSSGRISYFGRGFKLLSDVLTQIEVAVSAGSLDTTSRLTVRYWS